MRRQPTYLAETYGVNSLARRLPEQQFE